MVWLLHLPDLLNNLDIEWSISLFHYKNDGGDIASILIGFQIPDNDIPPFKLFKNSLNHIYYDETDNYNSIHV